MPVQKRRQKFLSVSNFAHLTVVFKSHHGSEGVKHEGNIPSDRKKWWQTSIVIVRKGFI